MQNLYEIRSDYLAVQELAEEGCDPQTVIDTLESIEDDFKNKAESIVVIMKRIDAKEKMFAEESARLKQVADSLHKVKDRMNESLMSCMIDIGKEKLETEHYNLSVRKKGGVLPMRITQELDTIPDSYKTFVPKADTAKIREELEKGVKLPFVYLEERGRYLSIK